MLASRNVEGAVLALDLGTYCGWAVRRIDQSIDYGEQPFQRKSGEPEGKRLYRFMQWLRLKVKQEQVGLIAFEDVLFQSSQAQTRLWSGWLTCTLLAAEYANIGAKGFPTNVVKQTASGHGGAGKPRMMASAKSLYAIERMIDDNEADALCTLHTCEMWLAGRLHLPSKRSKGAPKKRKAKQKQDELFS